MKRVWIPAVLGLVLVLGQCGPNDARIKCIDVVSRHVGRMELPQGQLNRITASIPSMCDDHNNDYERVIDLIKIQPPVEVLKHGICLDNGKLVWCER